MSSFVAGRLADSGATGSNQIVSDEELARQLQRQLDMAAYEQEDTHQHHHPPGLRYALSSPMSREQSKLCKYDACDCLRVRLGPFRISLAAHLVEFGVSVVSSLV